AGPGRADRRALSDDRRGLARVPGRARHPADRQGSSQAPVPDRLRPRRAPAVELAGRPRGRARQQLVLVQRSEPAARGGRARARDRDAAPIHARRSARQRRARARAPGPGRDRGPPGRGLPRARIHGPARARVHRRADRVGAGLPARRRSQAGRRHPATAASAPMTSGFAIRSAPMETVVTRSIAGAGLALSLAVGGWITSRLTLDTKAAVETTMARRVSPEQAQRQALELESSYATSEAYYQTRIDDAVAEHGVTAPGREQLLAPNTFFHVASPSDP